MTKAVDQRILVLDLSEPSHLILVNRGKQPILEYQAIVPFDLDFSQTGIARLVQGVLSTLTQAGIECRSLCIMGVHLPSVSLSKGAVSPNEFKTAVKSLKVKNKNSDTVEDLKLFKGKTQAILGMKVSTTDFKLLVDSFTNAGFNVCNVFEFQTNLATGLPAVVPKQPALSLAVLDSTVTIYASITGIPKGKKALDVNLKNASAEWCNQFGFMYEHFAYLMQVVGILDDSSLYPVLQNFGVDPSIWFNQVIPAYEGWLDHVIECLNAQLQHDSSSKMVLAGSLLSFKGTLQRLEDKMPSDRVVFPVYQDSIPWANMANATGSIVMPDMFLALMGLLSGQGFDVLNTLAGNLGGEGAKTLLTPVAGKSASASKQPTDKLVKETRAEKVARLKAEKAEKAAAKDSKNASAGTAGQNVAPDSQGSPSSVQKSKKGTKHGFFGSKKAQVTEDLAGATVEVEMAAKGVDVAGMSEAAGLSASTTAGVLAAGGAVAAATSVGADMNDGAADPKTAKKNAKKLKAEEKKRLAQQKKQAEMEAAKQKQMKSKQASRKAAAEQYEATHYEVGDAVAKLPSAKDRLINIPEDLARKVLENNLDARDNSMLIGLVMQAAVERIEDNAKVFRNMVLFSGFAVLCAGLVAVGSNYITDLKNGNPMEEISKLEAQKLQLVQTVEAKENYFRTKNEVFERYTPYMEYMYNNTSSTIVIDDFNLIGDTSLLINAKCKSSADFDKLLKDFTSLDPGMRVLESMGAQDPATGWIQCQFDISIGGDSSNE